MLVSFCWYYRLYFDIQKTAAKARVDRKRKKKKKGGATKQIEGLDILDQHTQSKLEEMERERINIYNFEVCCEVVTCLVVYMYK